MSNKSHENLNPEQKKAVLHTRGPLLILAGAGAGKTKTLTERIKHIISTGVNPSSIIAITFTNKAAREMRERIEKELREDSSLNLPISISERPFVGTFHSLGVHILREQAPKAEIKRNFVIFDRDDSKKAVKEALTKFGLDPKLHDPGQIMGIISKEKGMGTDVAEFYLKEGWGELREVTRQVWPEYERILKRDNALDFDDLLLKTCNLLNKDPEMANYYQNIWQYVHIDEYQDTNRVQYQISKKLVGPEKNICVVGDIDQNIYSWRGADIKNILDFENDYPDAEIIVLERNYRSTKNILEAANAIIKKNSVRREKNLFTENDLGEKISIFSAYDETAEAHFIASKAEEATRAGVSPEEIAVLYRANFQSRILEEAFMTKNVPYQILGTRFFERKEIKDLISYLRAALDPENLSDLKRIINVPTRGLGKTAVAKIFSGVENSLPTNTQLKYKNFKTLLSQIKEVSEKLKLSEVFSFIIKQTGLEKEWKEGGEDGAARLENAYELVNFATRYDELERREGVEGFLADAALQSDQDELKESHKAVRLMTVHASKGLEFETVFVSGLEDGLFPHQRINKNDISREEAEEERRLFYVALTRAKKKVFLTYAQVRTVFGRRQSNIPSEFIFDIPEELVSEENSDGIDLPRKPLLEIEF